MKYIRVKWIHSNPKYPVVMCSELDNEGWEQRKVESFFDGRCGYANKTEAFGGTRLGLAPVPTIEEIACDPQFEPIEISAMEFEELWTARQGIS